MKYKQALRLVLAIAILTSVAVSAHAENIDPELHLRGRPFLITEGSSARVSDLVDEYRAADEPRRVDGGLALTPLRASAGNIRPLLFAGEHAFFCGSAALV